MHALQNTSLINLYQQMSEHTRPKCASCMVPYSCCAPEHCQAAKEFAVMRGYTPPEETGHERLPYMGPTGCVMPPHMRPTCTVHACNIASIGFEPNDPEWTEKYFELRFAIEDTELEEAFNS